MLCYWCLNANKYICINEERNNEGKRRKFNMREQLKLIQENNMSELLEIGNIQRIRKNILEKWINGD